MAYKEGSKWRGVVRYTDLENKLHRKTRFFDKKKDATEWERGTLKALKLADTQRRSLRGIGEIMTVGRWAELYMAHAEVRWPGKTFEEKKRAFKRFFKNGGDPRAPITAVTPDLAQHCLNALAPTYSGSNVNRVRKNLVAAWNWGVKIHGLPRINPFNLVDRFAEKRCPRYVPPLEDVLAVLEVAGEYQKVVLLIAFYSAARKSELFRLKWSEVDFTENKVGFWTRKRKGGDWEFDTIPMAPTLRALLAERKLSHGREEYVFDQKTMVNDCKNKWLKRLCGIAGVREFGFHGIRHLSASVGANAGATAMDVQQLLRHKSLLTTTRYLHRLKNGNEAVDALEGAMAACVAQSEQSLKKAQ